MEVAFGHPVNRGIPVNDPAVGFNFMEHFDTLNFQSDGLSNFEFSSGNTIRTWIDRSPNKINATQQNTASQPTYGIDGVTFDGSNDFLQLGYDIPLSSFSLYVVIKATAWGDTIVGGINRLDFINISATNGITMSLAQNNSQTQGVNLGIDLNRFNLISIRRYLNSTLTIEMNNRVCVLTGNSVSVEQLFGFIGKNSAGGNWTGSMKAFCLASRYIEEGTHLKIKNEFYNRYNCPEAVYGTVIGLGDSITNGFISELGTTIGRSTVNLGVSGTRLTWESARALNMRQRFLTIPSRPYKDKLLILGGTNDIVFGVTAAEFGVELGQLVAWAIGKGWSASDICVCSTTYQQFNANAATLVSYQTECSSVALNYGTIYVDLYQQMLDYPGGFDTLMADQAHPNAAGYTAIVGMISTGTGW